ncbi:hypothetical protein [Microscilla marina]|uniref:Uncharacterized protein n=1 Tax=Microscilla marina ATCC 23134 TaxID=313606 RepID=A1ZF79_MICM2|nr:hypothetical protein [Microscilla marina]EAY31181.1 hypothetical protein M23134_07591 [Microscilla marina ATCC 23134]
MVKTFVLIFYMALNIVPSRVKQFKIEVKNPANQIEKIQLNFTRNKKQWQVIASHKPQDTLYFRFDKARYCYIREGSNGKESKADLLTKVEIKRNHRRWRKVSRVEFVPKQGKYNDRKSGLVFAISRKKRRKKLIEVDRTSAPEMSKAMPDMLLSW